MTEWNRWFDGKDFTTDWNSEFFQTWADQLAPLRHQPIRMLEIGSWEGRSATFFLEFFASGLLTCIDTFAGSPEHALVGAQADLLEQRFDRNLSGYGKRVEKIKSRSAPALDRLVETGRTFDLIYIDGSHACEDVAVDSALSWKLLGPDGFLIWDDYLWGQGKVPWQQRPQLAIESFLKMHAGELAVEHLGFQVIVRRCTRDEAPGLGGWRFPRTPRNLLRFLLGKPLGRPSGSDPKSRRDL
jgi:predicted O-methyltransferase YrrM